MRLTTTLALLATSLVTAATTSRPAMNVSDMLQGKKTFRVSVWLDSYYINTVWRLREGNVDWCETDKSKYERTDDMYGVTFGKVPHLRDRPIIFDDVAGWDSLQIWDLDAGVLVTTGSDPQSIVGKCWRDDGESCPLEDGESSRRYYLCDIMDTDA